MRPEGCSLLSPAPAQPKREQYSGLRPSQGAWGRHTSGGGGVLRSQLGPKAFWEGEEAESDEAGKRGHNYQEAGTTFPGETPVQFTGQTMPSSWRKEVPAEVPVRFRAAPPGGRWDPASAGAPRRGGPLRNPPRSANPGPVSPQEATSALLSLRCSLPKDQPTTVPALACVGPS